MNYQDGFEFEKRCAAFLKTKGYHKITVTPPSGDQGIDIIAYKSGLKYGIQCKYYSAPVGNKAVQEAYSGARFYDCNRAAVMTNHTFTKAARELADKLEVELWDYCNPTVQTDFFRKLSCVFLLLFLLAGISAGISMLIFEYPKPTFLNYSDIFSYDHCIPSGNLRMAIFFPESALWSFAPYFILSAVIFGNRKNSSGCFSSCVSSSGTSHVRTQYFSSPASCICRHRGRL